MSQIRVAIIGAGGAGLAMCRYLVNEPQIDFVAFEKAREIGGVWRYTKGNGEADDKQDPTPMYKYLRTNLPKEVMSYPDLPFSPELPSFITHEDVKVYLQTYADTFGLKNFIKLHHQVLSVKPSLDNKEKTVWNVVVKDLTNDTVLQRIFDAVVVCNGHFSVQHIPEIPGLDTFPGKVMHSMNYDKAKDNKDENVIVLGAGSSGLDLTIQLSEFSKKVYLVHLGNNLPTEFPENVEQVIGTLTGCFEDRSVEINHKELLQNIDSIFLCTGYKHSFPFLTPECEIKVSNNHVTSLYKHIFSTKFPSLSFIGLCLRICPFPNFAGQAQLIASVLTGRTKLPSQEEMVRDEKLDYDERIKQGLPKHKMHLLGNQRQYQYLKTIAEMIGKPCALTPTVQSLYTHIGMIRLKNLTSYRNANYTITECEWHELKNAEK